MKIHPHFAAAIGRNLQHWSDQVKTGDDAETKRLLPQQGEVLLAAQFGVALPDTQLAVATLFEQYFNLIERTRSESVWLPIIAQLESSPVLQADAERHAAVLCSHAILLRLARNYAASTACAEKLFERTPTPLQEGKMRLNLSMCHYEQGAVQAAFEQATFAYDCVLNAQDVKWQASALSMLGMIATDLARYDEAEQFLTEAFALEQHRDATRVVRVLINLGRLYEHLDQPYRALRTYFEAQEFLDETESVWDMIAVLVNLSNVYNNLEQPQKARDVLFEAEERIQRATGLQALHAMIKLNLGVAHYGLAEYEAAFAQTQHAQRLYCQLGNRMLLARTQVNLGNISRQLANVTAAISHYEEALVTLDDSTLPFANQLREEAQAALNQLRLPTM